MGELDGILRSSQVHHRLCLEEQRVGMGISQGMLRLSVGLEDVEDLADDLERGLAMLG